MSEGLEFKANIVFLRFDKKAFTQKLEAALKKLSKAAAVEFVNAAAPKVPILTGFARGTFLNILKAAGVAQSKLPDFSVLQNAEKGLKKTLSRPNFKFRPPRRKKFKVVQKSFQNSAQFATSPEDIISINVENGVAKFTFATTIDYFRINDASQNPRTPSSPWQSFEAGKTAYLNYLRANAVAGMPNPGKFIITTRAKPGEKSREVIGG